MSDRSHEFTIQVLKAIPGSGRKRDPDNQWGKSGTFDFKCQKCDKALFWSRVKSNGHVRVWCDTSDCFRLMS